MDNNQQQHTTYHYLRENFVLPVRLWIYRILRLTLGFFVLALLANFIFSYLFSTPKMWQLRQQNVELVAKYNTLNSLVKKDLEKAAEIRKRDQVVYHSIFSEDTVDIEGIWNHYPDSKYASISHDRYSPLILESWHGIDALTRQLYAQSVSFDVIEKLSVNKDMMAECIPAIWPMDKRFLRGHIGKFGIRINPFDRSRVEGHAGIDLAAPTGTSIYATAMGVVVIASEGRGYGLQVMVDHGFGYKTRYAHMSRIRATVGQVVKRGEIIGDIGSTGRSTGPHLHYEVIYRGTPLNPMSYLSRDMNESEFRDIIARARETTYEDKTKD